jgi:hypothetical protein
VEPVAQVDDVDQAVLDDRVAPITTFSFRPESGSDDSRGSSNVTVPSGSGVNSASWYGCVGSSTLTAWKPPECHVLNARAVMSLTIRPSALALAAVSVSLLVAPSANAARYTVDIGKLPGKGAGLFEAAANSPLTVCDGDGGEVSVSSEETDTTVDVGEGVISVS